MQLLHYHPKTGQILGIYTSEIVAHLEANRLDDATRRSLLTDTALTAAEHDRYEVREGEVQGKVLLELVAQPATLVADGHQECVITLTPFRPAVLDINGYQIRLTQEDQRLTLTTDTPQIFTIRLLPMPGYWALPLTVEAS